jgi:hypothetical protein
MMSFYEWAVNLFACFVVTIWTPLILILSPMTVAEELYDAKRIWLNSVIYPAQDWLGIGG